MIPKFIAKIENGAFCFFGSQKRLYEQTIRKLEGKIVYLVVDKVHQKRSLQQNRYYFGVVVAILADHWGYTVDEAHEAIKYQFLRIPAEYEDGKMIKPETIGSTTKFDTTGFNDFLEKVKQWAAEKFDVYIPDPDEVYMPEDV